MRTLPTAACVRDRRQVIRIRDVQVVGLAQICDTKYIVQVGEVGGVE